MVYLFIGSLIKEYPVRVLCSTLEVSFSSFYSWKRQETYTLSDKKKVLSEKVKGVFQEHRSRYGALRISAELRSQGEKIGPKLTQTLMKNQNLKAIQPRSFVPKTTNSNHGLGRSENLLLDRESTKSINEVFVGDITYIPMCNGGWLYLASWQDMKSRKIVGWELADNMRSQLVISALQKAIDRRILPEGLIIHSDGGGQYASKEFRDLLQKHKFKQSMTRRDNHYDNAMGESFFSRFKAELIQKGNFLTFEDAYTEIFEYIEIYYNLKRRHSGIGYAIPEEYEIKFVNEGNRIYVCEEKITKPLPNEWVQSASIVSKNLASQNVN
jgi:putative transposase